MVCVAKHWVKGGRRNIDWEDEVWGMNWWSEGD